MEAHPAAAAVQAAAGRMLAILTLAPTLRLTPTLSVTRTLTLTLTLIQALTLTPSPGRMLANLTNGDMACKHAALDAGALRAVTATMAR